ncbi:MAG: peptidoglycan bridge formation glycyltransferase FemA/FemB family protein [Candidatus Saccharimonas sp.]
MQVELCENPEYWDETVHELGGHPLQLWGWGEVKSAHGWAAHRLLFRDGLEVKGMAQVLTRKLPWPFKRFVYVPRGPVCADTDQDEVLETIATYAKEYMQGAVLSVEPPRELMPAGEGWQKSSNTILIPNTLILDLTQSEEELQAAMTKKTRQYIRKSTQEGLTIRRVKQRELLVDCLGIYHETAERAGFPIHADQYYYDVFDKLGDASIIFAASDEQGPVAFLWLAVSAGTAFELYGGMNDKGQQLRANYALKWHAISECKKWGVKQYDLNGLLNDRISTFKRGFASHETELAGTYDYPLSPLYAIWATLLPTAKRTLRKIKSLRIRQR